VEEAARPATADDLARLTELAAEAVAEQAGARGGRVWSVREARPLPAGPSLAADLADGARLVLAGTIDGTVVGYLVAGVETLRDGAVLAVVSDLYVEPGARAVGVGEHLVERATEWCRDRGATGIDATVLPGNRETKNFFETMGFTARALTVHRAL
jgi:GNAT superfamily N-acetyltransferase